MTSKEKLIGRAQRVQVAAQAAGFRAHLVLREDGIEISTFDVEEYTILFRISLTYGCGDDLQAAILGSLAEFLAPKTVQKGGEA